MIMKTTESSLNLSEDLKNNFFSAFFEKKPLNFQWKLLPEGAVTTKIWQQFFWLGFWKAGPNFQFLKLPIFAFFRFFEYSRTAWEKKIVQPLTLLLKARLHIFTGNISILWEPACEQTPGTFSYTRVGGSWKKVRKNLNVCLCDSIINSHIRFDGWN